MTFPRHQGQIPLYYNHMKTGRPYDPIHHPHNHYTSRYIDSSNMPLYPFGYGLSYSKFSYEHFKVDEKDNHIILSFDVTNSSIHAGHEVIQLYIEAEHFSVTRPVNELKRFDKVYLNPNETKHIVMTLTEEDFKSFGYPMVYGHESASYLVKIGLNADEMLFSTTVQMKEEV